LVASAGWAAGNSITAQAQALVPLPMSMSMSMSQPPSLAAIWPWPDAIDPLAERWLGLEVDALAAQLRELPEPRRLKVLHDWVVLSLRYALDRGAAQTPEAVLARRTASCEGYAGLVREVGRRAGLEVETVHGLVSVPGGPPRAHAWNAVRLEGRWQLLDTTLDDPTIRGDGDERNAYRTDYFLVPPEIAELDHWPFLARWQLTDARPSRDTFRRQVRLVTAGLLRAGLRVVAGPTELEETTRLVVSNDRGRFVFLAQDGRRCGSPSSAARLELKCPRRDGGRLELFVSDAAVGLFLSVHEFDRGLAEDREGARDAG
jgi:hypothetical protein